ncbi:UNVERIFIED_CONTAM: hypothetical protein HDU68_001662 [Siphonaria sp. JEL0065]|nr:hypothetical protein HDU68_001662 [Siphonaria sp. JEL0065]
MWATDNLTDPVATFSGHTDVVKEFVWRNCGGSPGIHPSPISNLHSRFNATPTAAAGINEIGIPIIHEPDRKQKGGNVTASEDEYSEVGSYTGRGSGILMTGSLRSVGSAGGAGNEFEGELLSIADGLKVWGPSLSQNLTVDNVDPSSRVISITIRRPVFTPEAVPVHVNILFNDDSPSQRAPGTPQLEAKKPTPQHQSKKLTHFPSFEIVRSGMIPMAQRQNLSSRLHTLYVFLCAKRIPTFEPCMRFLAYDDPNAGLDTNEAGYVGGIDGLLGTGSASGGAGGVNAVGGSGAVVGNASNPGLNRNISGLFGPTLGGSGLPGSSFDDEMGRGGLRLTELKALSFGEEDGHMVRGLKVSVGSGSGAQPGSFASEKSGGGGIAVGSMASNEGEKPSSKKISATILGSYDDAASSSDDSDERLGVGGRQQAPGAFKRLNQKLGMRDIGVAGNIGIKDDTNIPFPRLCGASFSMGGHLACFFSPLPHPAQVKYAAYSLSTRRQQPLFQTYQFTTNYVMFEHFRNFLVQKSSAESSANLSGNNANRAASALVQSAANRNFANLLGQNREDWVGDDEVDGETSLQNLFMNQTRGSVSGGGVDGQYVSTSDLLNRLRSHGLAKRLDNDGAVMSDLMDAVAERTTALQLAEDREKSKLTYNEISNLSRSRSNSLPKLLDANNSNDGHQIISHSDPVSRSPTPNETHIFSPRRPSIFTVGSVEAGMNEMEETISNVPSSSDLLSPLSQRLGGSQRTSRVRAKSMQMEGFGATSFNSDTSSPADRLFSRANARHMSSNSADGTPSSSYTTSARVRQGIGAIEASWHSGSDITTTAPRSHKKSKTALIGTDVEGKGCGIVVFLKDIREMLPVSSNLAKDYTLTGTDPVAICSANSVVASKHNRNDLAKLWTIAGLILARVSGVSDPSRNEAHSDSDSITSEDFGGMTKPTIMLAASTPSFGSKRRNSTALLNRLQGAPNLLNRNAKDTLQLRKDGTFGIRNEVIDKPFVQSPDIKYPERYPSLSSTFQSNYSQSYFPHRQLAKRASTPNQSLNLGPIENLNNEASSPKSNRHLIARTYSGGKLVGISAGPNAGGVPRSRPIKTPAHLNNHNVSTLGSQPVIGSYVSDGTGSYLNDPSGSNKDSVLKPKHSGSSFGIVPSPIGRKLMKSPMVPRQNSGGSGGLIGCDVFDVRDFNTSAEHSGRRLMNILIPPRMESGGREGGGGGGVKAAEESQTGDYSLDLLNPARRHVFDGYKIKYAEILFAWKLLEKRAEILKFVSTQVADLTLVESTIGTGSRIDELQTSSSVSSDIEIVTLAKASGVVVVCSVCRMPCKGLLSSCIKCGHGGHISHIQAWFRDADGGKNATRECAVGDCGCKCLI